MSYILDALKKSDTERKQGDVPNLQTIHIPIAIEPQAPLALYGLISFLLLILAFVIGWIVANDDSPTDRVQLVEPIVQPVVPALVKPVVKPVVQPQIIETQNSIKNVPQTGKTLATQTLKPVIQKKPEKVAKATALEKPEVYIEPAKNKLPIAAPLATSRPDLSDIPYLHEMPDYQQQSIPQMTFSGHVYSSSPSSRSVIINDVFMSEGDTVLQGIDVVEITPSGVVFSLHDEFFRMDILQDWSFE